MFTRSGKLFLAACFIFLAGLWTGTGAQTSGVTADLGGTVVDETGAVLPGVSIAITSNSTGIARTVLADEKGAFLAQNLPPGTFTVKAELNAAIFRSG